MVITRLQRPSSNTTATTSTAVFPVFQTAERSINQSQTRENRFLAIVESTRASQAAGYCVIDKWECEDQKTQEVLPQQETETYPNAIFYDFESYHDCKPQKNKVTASLTYENAHVPISVSIGHIYDPRPKELIRKFMQELEARERHSGRRQSGVNARRY